jgi:hypothetical protein
LSDLSWFWDRILALGIDDSVRSAIYPLFHRGLHLQESWNLMGPIAERFLMETRHATLDWNGFPTSLQGDAADAADDSLAMAVWRTEFRRMRCAFFYTRIVLEPEFVGMYRDMQEMRCCFVWTRKAYWWAADQLTWRRFKGIHSDRTALIVRMRPACEAGMRSFAQHFESLWD